VPGGGLAADGSRWIACRPGFFLPVRVLSRVFRRKFLALLRSGQHGAIAEDSQKRTLGGLLS
jgi:Putative transposase